MAATSPIRISPCVPCTHAYTAFPAARSARTPSPAYACGGCYQRVSSQTRVYPALWVYPAVLSTLLLELVVAVELLAVAQSLRVRVAPQEPVAKTHMNSGYQRARRTMTQPVPTRAGRRMGPWNGAAVLASSPVGIAEAEQTAEWVIAAVSI